MNYNSLQGFYPTKCPLALIFSEKEWQELTEQEDGFAERISSHRSWIKTSEFALDGIITERMALIHLLWLQKVGRVIIEDIDPLAGALLVRLDFSIFEKKGK